ncbi:CoA ligase [Rubrivivax sp. A210]|uniref:AMP-binding protein n=1 Tax=Rubrivivax sp. A210 TaxID=2772301 RepID=UPI0019180D84|nr:AMP-binding protein [Rubrivivax sp. A210]CAD5372046.1 CoA ligase [Rubrivivax sp. A210]
MSDLLPLLAERDLAAPLAWRGGQAVSGAQFIAEARALAQQLPDGRPINLCQDRLHFALAFAAALLRGQTSLLPPNALPETLRQIPGDGTAAYLLADDPDLDAGGLPLLSVQRPTDVEPAQAMPQIAASQAAACLLTSGSTGVPQPHSRRWRQLVASVEAEAERLAALMGRASLAGVNIVATVPAQHSYGFESSVLLALLGGAAFDAGRPFYPADIAEGLARLPRPRALVTTPLHLKTLLLAGVALPPVDLVLSATAPLSPQLAAQAEAAFGGILAEIYGCTEAGQVAARRTTAGETWTTLGAMRLRQESGAGADLGEGRYLVDGGPVEEATPLADVLVLEDERHFRLLGRANDLIHVAGKRSSLAHLNFHLNRIEGVADGAFWLPDARGEEVVRPVALVVAPGLSAQQIITALREHLEGAFVPRRVIQVEALPREATGKLTATALARFARQTLGIADADADADAEEAVVDLRIAPGHPAFAGHFPGRPLLPGAALLSLVVQALERQPALRHRLGATPAIASAKFLAPVGPGARLRLGLRAQGQGLAFEIREGDTPVARGQLTAGAAG